METFAPGDRVVAINTDLSAPILPPVKGHLHSFSFPDGPLRRGVVYHVAAVRPHSDNAQGVFITGSRVMWGPHEIPWHFSRFRRIEEAGHPPVSCKQARSTRLNKIKLVASEM